MKRKSHFLEFVVIAIIFSLGVACAKKLDDAKMSSDIQSKYSQDSGLASKQLTVQANNGVVTLSGTVDNEAQRQAAARQAAAEPGVKTVINNLQVGDSSAIASASQKPMPGDAATAPDSAAASPPPVEKSKPAKAKKTRRHQAEDSAAGQDSGQQQMAANNPPPDNSAAPPPVDNTPAPPPAPPAPKKLIIDQGTQLTVRLVDPIDSEKNQTGDTFHATLNAPLTSDGEQAVPAGVELTGHLVEVKSAGKFAGASSVVMQLDSLTSAGKTYNLQTDQYHKTGSSRGKNTAEKVGGGAVIGGIIGALAGGGKGAAIGAAAGAGVGGGVQAATKGQQIKLPSETVLNFTLQAPITVVQASNADANRQKLNESQQP
ncbi:MAG TPA: BON domain-containing protein [Candidatus Sulfotelmatobacter sp.]|nr:BON domain-containing protein [Candidatus Sulfotelmatobacter sp.]